MINKKGFVPVTLLMVKYSFILIGVACLWHVPAWTKAKAEGKTAEYQAQKMWPQQEFDKLPGGNENPNTLVLPNGSGNRGNFIGGNSI